MSNWKLPIRVLLLVLADYQREVETPRILAKPQPKGSTFSDWRMALRRKLNGDTR